MSIESTSWVLNSFNDGSMAFANLISDTEITAEIEVDMSLTGFAGDRLGWVYFYPLEKRV